VLPPLARGDVVLVSFPFTDLSARKVRPALIVGRPSGDDLILAFIGSRSAGTNPRAECLLEPTDPEFVQTGLKGSSSVHLDKLATLHRYLVHRRMGRIGPRAGDSVARALRYVFEI
jgi:mRNA interferase MazF